MQQDDTLLWVKKYKLFIRYKAHHTKYERSRFVADTSVAEIEFSEFGQMMNVQDIMILQRHIFEK